MLTDKSDSGPEVRYSDDDLNAALAFVEEFVDLVEGFKQLGEKLSGDDKNHLSVLTAKLETLVQILDTERIPIPLVRENKLAGNQYRSVIEKLGLAGELIRLRQGKWTVKRICEHFDLAPRTVSRFFQYYDSMKPTEKVKYARKSVFDSTERLEELQVMILRQIARLEGSDDDIAVKYVSELRQTIQLAVTVSEKIANYQRYQSFTQLVSEILLQEIPPERRLAVLGKIEQHIPLTATLMPSA